MTPTRATSSKHRRRRERKGLVAVAVLAGASGLLAAHFGTHRAWESSPARPPASTSTSVPFVNTQGTP
ncbi:MAG TPA: hypothetical protein VIK54_03205 [Acidimicrobiia bacterium]